MNIYTVARIIKHNMKNVIIYVGDIHAEHITDIFNELNYTIIIRELKSL